MSASRHDTRRRREFRLIRGVWVDDYGRLVVLPSVLRRPVIGDRGGRKRRYRRQSLKWTAYDEDWAKIALSRACATRVAFQEQLDEVGPTIIAARLAVANARLIALAPRDVNQLAFASY